MKFVMNTFVKIVIIFVVFVLGFMQSAEAYVGPGAGFAFLSSFLMLAAAFVLAFFSLLCWPLRFAIKALRRRQSSSHRQAKRVIILGFDGMDPGLTTRFIEEGKLPHFHQLKQQGSFAPLATSYPSISPAAWSSFMTGADSSHHNIFDFITRDPCTYAPMLSSTEIGRAAKVLPLGKYRLPLSKLKMSLLRKRQPFWKLLGESRIFSAIIRVPITFPPETFHGVLLSGMCTPDLKGSQGTFTYYTTSTTDAKGREGGVQIQVSRCGDTIQTLLYGPENSLVRDGGTLTLPLTLTLDDHHNWVDLKISGQTYRLEPRTYSPWISVAFQPGLGMKVHGICRFYLNRIQPEFELYVSPINIDPEKPALPISHPFIYSVYLAKLLGPYATLGLAEDTWALNEGVLDEEAFLQQAYLNCDERERMLFSMLDKTKNGLCVCVFDTTDRVQHMFFRCLDETHPANRGKETAKYAHVIEELYQHVDTILGRVMTRIDDDTVLLVMSDHGFTQFKRGVNINTWLLQHGYLVLKEGHTTSGDWFEAVDWQRTKAYSLGLIGLFINRKGREACGIVAEGEELNRLKQELIAQLTGLVDDETGDIAIRELIDTEAIQAGPYVYDAPDLLLGYNAGYRNSWAGAKGGVSASVFEDNTKHWSGDHCVDPRLVPGILFCNRPIQTATPDIKDIAPTVLHLFGTDIPSYMQGKPLLGQPPDDDPAQVQPIVEHARADARDMQQVNVP